MKNVDTAKAFIKDAKIILEESEDSFLKGHYHRTIYLFDHKDCLYISIHINVHNLHHHALNFGALCDNFNNFSVVRIFVSDTDRSVKGKTIKTTTSPLQYIVLFFPVVIDCVLKLSFCLNCLILCFNFL